MALRSLNTLLRYDPKVLARRKARQPIREAFLDSTAPRNEEGGQGQPILLF